MVGLPAAVEAVLAWRGDRNTDRAAVLTGVLLLGWIVVEIAFIRELSFLQLVFAGAGAIFIGVGRRSMRRTRTRT